MLKNNNHNVKLAVGFIIYGKITLKYLPYFLPSLYKQNFQDFIIFVFDNSDDFENENIKYIKENYPDIEIERVGKNIGFSRAHNIMIKKALNIGARYYLALNCDIILEPDVLGTMVGDMDRGGNLGSICPKVLKWDYKNNKKTKIIDSCGIQMQTGLKFIDIGQGQIDTEQFNNANILGPSGVSAMYRISALEKVSEHNQYFNELMFMYKEDCDLAYRLFLAGFKSKCAYSAIVYHDRTVSGCGEDNYNIAINRKKKSRQSKKWSFLNQHIIFLKYWKLQNCYGKLAIIWQEIKMLAFVFLFEQYLLKEYLRLWKIRNKI